MIPTALADPTTPKDALYSLYAVIQAMNGVVALGRLEVLEGDDLQNMAWLIALFLEPLEAAYCVLADASRALPPTDDA